MNRRKGRKKISFVFDILFLVLGIIGGIVFLVCDFFGIITLHQYTVIGIAVLEALCVATIITIATLVRKYNRERERDDENDW